MIDRGSKELPIVPSTDPDRLDQSPKNSRSSCLGEPNLRPDLCKGIHQMLDVGISVMRRRRDAQPLSAARHGRVVDRLHLNAVALDQHIADLLAQDRVADHHRDDVAGIVQVSNPCLIEPPAQPRDAILMPLSFRRARFQMTDAGKRASSDRRR